MSPLSFLLSLAAILARPDKAAVTGSGRRHVNSTQEPEYPLSHPHLFAHAGGAFQPHALRTWARQLPPAPPVMPQQDAYSCTHTASWRPVLRERTIAPSICQHATASSQPDSFGLPLGRAHVRGRARAPAARWIRRLSVG